MAAVLLTLLATVTLVSASVYGSISPASYLIGDFDPQRSPLFSPVKSFNVPVGTNYTIYIRNEAGTALSNMIQDFTGLTGIAVPVYGAATNLTLVKESWEAHFADNYMPLVCNNTLERCLAVMEVTPMPGTARHAWGTEVDLFSADSRNSDFDSGNGSIWYTWMTANASRYGFYEPYTSGRCAGYTQQKWHWSYKALAAEMLKDWNKYYGNNVCTFVSAINFTGVDACGYLAPVYVKTINPLAGPDWNAPPTDWPILAIIVVFVLAGCFAIVTILFLVLLIRSPPFRRGADKAAGYVPVSDRASIQ